MIPLPYLIPTTTTSKENTHITLHYKIIVLFNRYIVIPLNRPILVLNILILCRYFVVGIIAKLFSILHKREKPLHMKVGRTVRQKDCKSEPALRL